MTVQLDSSIRELFLSWGDYAVVPEIGSDGEGAVLFKAPLADIRAWRGSPLLWQWQVGLYVPHRRTAAPAPRRGRALRGAGRPLMQGGLRGGDLPESGRLC